MVKPRADHAGQRVAPVGLPFGKPADAVARAAIDVHEGVWPHHHVAGYRRPVVVQPLVVVFTSDAQLVTRGYRQFQLECGAEGMDLGDHRHCAGELVLQEVHLVVGIAVISRELHRAPVEFSVITGVEEPRLVGDHVHRLVGEAFIGRKVVATLQLEQPGIVLKREGEGMVGLGVFGRADPPEIATGLVLLCLGIGAGVGCTEVGARHRQQRRAAKTIAVGTIERGNLTSHQRGAVASEAGSYALDRDDPADVVAAHADRRHARHDPDRFDRLRNRIGQRRVHVVGAGQIDRRAINRNAQSLLGQTAQSRHRGEPAARIGADTGQLAQQIAGIACRVVAALDVLACQFSSCHRSSAHAIGRICGICIDRGQLRDFLCVRGKRQQGG